eukprot:7115305-Prymnesium_polylepis.1
MVSIRSAIPTISAPASCASAAAGPSASTCTEALLFSSHRERVPAKLTAHRDTDGIASAMR